jgi:protein ImuA
MTARRAPGYGEGDLLARLRDRIAAIEGTRPATGGPGLALGAAEVDGALPWGGLRADGLHEVIAADTGAAGAVMGFAAGLLARATAAGGTALWCSPARTLAETGGLYGPGLAAFGLAPERLVVVRGRNDTEVLWAMEEGLRSRRLAAVLGEVEALDLTASRRLQLAAEHGGTPALALRPRGAETQLSAALTRWRLGAAPAAEGEGRARWQVELWRCRGGGRGSWLLEWCDETGDFTVAADLPDRPAEPAAAGTAGDTLRRAG